MRTLAMPTAARVHTQKQRFVDRAMLFITLLVISVLFFSGCANEDHASGDTMPEGTARILNASATPEEWLTYGGGYDEQRYSLLTGINKDNLDQLKPAWTYEMRRTRGVEATSLVVDGVIYVTGSWSIVYALDAKTGKELWVHDPAVPGETAVKGCCGPVNRGVAYYEGKIFSATFDGRLQALDANTGNVIWSVVTVDPSKPYTITGAPRTAKGLVFIGNGGAELGVRGYLSAYDANTGDLVWRFYTTPNPKKAPDGAASDSIFASYANDSWGDSGAWTIVGGGGTVWDSIAYDTVNDNIVFGVGNGSPWNAALRDPDSDGDNLFLSSIVAVDASTGAYKWHFQTTPREQWDYTATQHIMLADLPLGENGELRRVVMQAPKNGYFYVLDAKTGAFIHADTLAPVTWSEGLDENGRPTISEAARDTKNGALVQPNTHGAHNWHPMAFNRETGFVYIPTVMMGGAFKDIDMATAVGSSRALGYDVSAIVPAEYKPAFLESIRSRNMGALSAWDPVANKLAWRQITATRDNSGILSTAAGLVFQGDLNGDFFAYDAATGDVLWQADVGNGMMAAPSTYEIDGEQYIVLGTGPGGAYNLVFGFDHDEPAQPALGRIVAFKIGGDAEIPHLDAATVEPTPKTDSFGDKDMISLGLNRYANFCAGCHGVLAISGGTTPDLRWSYISADKNAWDSVVADGVLNDNGMISFSGLLSAEEIEAIRAYVINQGHLAVRNDAEN